MVVTFGWKDYEKNISFFFLFCMLSSVPTSYSKLSEVFKREDVIVPTHSKQGYLWDLITDYNTEEKRV